MFFFLKARLFTQFAAVDTRTAVKLAPPARFDAAILGVPFAVTPYNSSHRQS
jgi:hypothetical protein